MIAVFGSLSKDRIVLPASETMNDQVGGGVYYSSLTIAHLGEEVLALPLLAQKDGEMLETLRHPRLRVIPQWTDETTSYLNTYSTFDVCEKKILSRARHFRPGVDFFNAIAACSAIHISPLSSDELISDFYAELRGRFHGIMSLDGQGFTRGGQNSLDFLHNCVDILKVDEEEALKLACTDDLQDAMLKFSRWGVKEVLVTQGSRGSMILAAGKTDSVPPYSPKRNVDPTGCGDAYIAAYLVKRLQGGSAVESAHFASLIGAKNVEHRGAISQDW